MALMDLFKLDGQVAFITGGGTGLGRAMAEGLAEAGADIAMIGRREHVVAEAAQDLLRFGHRTLAISGDIGREDDVKMAVDRIMAEFGRLDIAIANAGVAGYEGPFPDLQTWQGKVDSHLTGTYLTAREAARVMVPQRRGKIIAVSSIRGVVADPEGDNPAYCAVKGGILNLSRTLAVHLAPHGIQVNCIIAGTFNTPRSKRIFEATDEETKIVAQGYLKRVAQHRIAEPEEIKGLALFLASAASDYITGAAIPIDGGYLAH